MENLKKELQSKFESITMDYNLTSDQMAALFYKELWLLGEMPNEEDIKNGYTCEGPVLSDTDNQELTAEIKDYLSELGYDPDPVFDNEGEPIITWKDPEFNYLDFLAEDCDSD